MFFVEEKQTEDRVFGSNFLFIYARPSKVLTTESLVFFRGDYEIESGQGNDTASGPRGRQTERPAVESPHYREACLFSDERDGEGAHYLSVATFFWHVCASCLTQPNKTTP